MTVPGTALCPAHTCPVSWGTGPVFSLGQMLQVVPAGVKRESPVPKSVPPTVCCRQLPGLQLAPPQDEDRGHRRELAWAECTGACPGPGCGALVGLAGSTPLNLWEEPCPHPLVISCWDLAFEEVLVSLWEVIQEWHLSHPSCLLLSWQQQELRTDKADMVTVPTGLLGGGADLTNKSTNQ